MRYAPTAAQGERDPVPDQVDFGAIGVHPVVVGISGEGLLNSIDCTIDIDFGHTGDFDRHGELMKE